MPRRGGTAWGSAVPVFADGARVALRTDVRLFDRLDESERVTNACRADTLDRRTRTTRTTPTVQRRLEVDSMVKEGGLAPDFTLRSEEGAEVTLSSLRGSPVVLYFYPKDDTPGCTTQACALRDSYDEFSERGAVVLGVSPDTETSHVKFKEKYGLPFTLLADPDHHVADDYGTWVEKKNYGKTYMGIERSTFLIDSEGKVTKVMRRVKPDTHADEVLAALPD
jgi:peroxiredoxin Q/BCP